MRRVETQTPSGPIQKAAVVSCRHVAQPKQLDWTSAVGVGLPFCWLARIGNGAGCAYGTASAVAT
jgi:hypothetical protein